MASGGHRFEARFEEQLLQKWVTHLNIGALLLGFLCEFRGGQQRCAVNAVAARFRADVNHGIALALSLGVEERIFGGHAQRENIYERIACVAWLEGYFAARGGHAETISVVRDAANHAADQAAIGACDGF